MRSWDPMKNFPELDGLDRREAEKLRRTTQRRVSLRPAVFAGLLATGVLAGLVIFSALPTESILQTAIAGGLLGVAVVVYMVLIIKPRMHAEFRAQGYPRAPTQGS